MVDRPIEIVGAGPAGLAAALTIARAGRRALVHERFATVGHRFHGDFQGLENWSADQDVLEELGELGIEPGFDHTPFREVVAFAPNGREHVFRSERPLFYLVRRGPGPGTLDDALRNQAESHGVDLRFGSLRRHLPDGGVVADGPRGADAIAVGYVFETPAADGAYAAVSERLAPGGYAYLLVRQGRATLATCLFDDFHRERTYLDRAAAFFEARLGVVARDPQRFGGLGNFAVPGTARIGRRAFAGEAAGFQDALWGFGMRFALVSGHLAARAMLAGRPEDYDAAWQARLGGLLRAGVVNRWLYRLLGDRGYAAFLGVAERAADPRAWLGRQYRPSLLKTLLYPLARRGVISRRKALPCVRADCDCTWCRCARDHRATALVRELVA